MRKHVIPLIFLALCALCFAFSNSFLFFNMSKRFFEKNNFPVESSIFTFKPLLIMGNGNNWIYAEDIDHYYYNLSNPYTAIKKDNLCSGFDKLNYMTWCGLLQEDSNGIPSIVHNKDGTTELRYYGTLLEDK